MDKPQTDLGNYFESLWWTRDDRGVLRCTRAVSPGQKQYVMHKLLELWLSAPQLRLGQLMKCTPLIDLFNVEDYDLIDMIEKVIRTDPQPESSPTE